MPDIRLEETLEKAEVESNSISTNGEPPQESARHVHGISGEFFPGDLTETFDEFDDDDRLEDK